MAIDAASGWVLDELEDGRPVLDVSALEALKRRAGQPASAGYRRLCRKIRR
ncbi:MAG: hypothetical protein LBK69_00530 [Syntrophomonadaceae bacterium]|nr:hypothetical protein [Syntrophomonadaceae bacterium]